MRTGDVLLRASSSLRSLGSYYRPITRTMKLSEDMRNNENQTKIIIYIALFVFITVVARLPGSLLGLTPTNQFSCRLLCVPVALLG